MRVRVRVCMCVCVCRFVRIVKVCVCVCVCMCVCACFACACVRALTPSVVFFLSLAPYGIRAGAKKVGRKEKHGDKKIPLEMY